MPVEFGLDFFPDMRPNEKSGAQYFAETLRIARECEDLGSRRIKIVEHYFHPYGGYSPNPVVYLSAAAAVTKKQRLMTRAFLPHEFAAFGVSMDDSRGRFEEGIEALKLLWTRDDVTFHGKYHSFENV